MNDRSIVQDYLMLECDTETSVGVMNDDDMDDNEDDDKHKDLHEIGDDSHHCSFLQIDLVTSHLTSGKIMYIQFHTSYFLCHVFIMVKSFFLSFPYLTVHLKLTSHWICILELIIYGKNTKNLLQ